MQQRATFTRMRDGTRQDYKIIERAEEEFNETLPARVLDAVRSLETSGSAGYPVDRMEHSLQSASRALRDGRETEYIVAALIHDIGDPIAPHSHGTYAASVLRPFVAERISWIVEHHPVFQMYYYAPNMGGSKHARERYRGHRWFNDCVEFCELYDENCFDSQYESLPLETFEPMVYEVFQRDPWSLSAERA